MFLNILIAHGGKASNKYMQQSLECTKNEYEHARDELIKQKVVKKIRMRGGGIEYVPEYDTEFKVGE